MVDSRPGRQTVNPEYSFISPLFVMSRTESEGRGIALFQVWLVDTYRATSTPASISKDGPADKRSCQVDFGLYERLAADHKPQMTLKTAIEDLAERLDFMKFNDGDFRKDGSPQLARQ